MKPGWKTTEFWSWLTSMGVSTALAVLVLHKDYADPWLDLGVYAGKAVVDMVTTAFYIWARTQIKLDDK
jgi:hypothetical protein